MSDVAEEKPRLKVEEAVRSAIRALPSFLGGQSLQGVRVEEVFPPREDPCWRITLSHLEPGVEKPRHPALAALESPFRAPPSPERVFHVLEVDASTGEVLSMRLREEPR
jgi:hypothetical protein